MKELSQPYRSRTNPLHIHNIHIHHTSILLCHIYYLNHNVGSEFNISFFQVRLQSSSLSHCLHHGNISKFHLSIGQAQQGHQDGPSSCQLPICMPLPIINFLPTLLVILGSPKFSIEKCDSLVTLGGLSEVVNSPNLEDKWNDEQNANPKRIQLWMIRTCGSSHQKLLFVIYLSSIIDVKPELQSIVQKGCVFNWSNLLVSLRPTSGDWCLPSLKSGATVSWPALKTPGRRPSQSSCNQ